MYIEAELSRSERPGLSLRSRREQGLVTWLCLEHLVLTGFGWWTTKCYKRTESLCGEHYHLSLKLNSRMKGGNEARRTFLTSLSISGVRDSHCHRYEGELWSLVIAGQEIHFFSYLVDTVTTHGCLWGKVQDHWWARSMVTHEVVIVK